MKDVQEGYARADEIDSQSEQQEETSFECLEEFHRLQVVRPCAEMLVITHPGLLVVSTFFEHAVSSV